MMNPLDRNLDGCCVRGLPIGRPFRTRFEVPKGYEASFTDTTDVFILLRYQDMQGGEVIDLLSETERQDLPLETKENTLKRRILNRQSIINEESADVHASESEVHVLQNSDIDSVAIADLLQLHVSSETEKSYYTDPKSSDTCGALVESDFKSMNLFDTGQVVEARAEQLTELQEDTVTETDKIIHALANREPIDKNASNEADDYDDFLYASKSETMKDEAINENKNVIESDNNIEDSDKSVPEPSFDNHVLRGSKRKHEDQAPEVNEVKLKKVAAEESENNESRRISKRLQSAGHQTDFEAIKKNNDNIIDDDDTDDYDVDNKKTSKSVRKQKSKSKTNSRYTALKKSKSNPKSNDEDIKPDPNKLDVAIKIKSSASHKKESHKMSTLKRNKIRIGKRKGNTRIASNLKTGSVVGKHRHNTRSLKNHIAEAEMEPELVDDPLDPDFNPAENDETKHSGTDEEEKLTQTSRKKKQKNENDSDSKSKQGRKSKVMKTRNSKANITDDDDSSLIESDPDLVGLAPYKRQILLARKRKILEQQEKQATRIKVKLHEHTDKWKRDVMDSYMRKDRGKARYEVAVEMYMCTVCDKYKAESKESMEIHLEMHVNGDLQCNHPNCSHIAVTNFELQKHKRDVHKKNIWICDICGLETIGREGLKDHMGRVHNMPQYSCKLCLEKNETKFASVTLHEHKKHLRAAHPESMYRCDGCKRLFAQKHKLDNHLKIGCEGEGRKELPCEKCGKVFSSQDSVKRHIMRVHNKERSFQCPYCPFTAARQTNLTSHLNVHEGYHPFKCDQCTFSCVQKYQLKSHMRTHSGEKPYKCAQCSYAAAWNVQLKDHVKAHSLPDAVKCEQCNIVFKDIRALKTHETKEHGMSHSGSSGVQKEVKADSVIEVKFNQIVEQTIEHNNVNSTFTVPQTYTQVINYSAPYIPGQHPLPYLTQYATYENIGISQQ